MVISMLFLNPSPSSFDEMKYQNQVLKKHVTDLETVNNILALQVDQQQQEKQTLDKQNKILTDAAAAAARRMKQDPTLDNCIDENEILKQIITNRGSAISKVESINLNQGIQLVHKDTIISLERQQLQNCEEAFADYVHTNKKKQIVSYTIAGISIILLLLK